MARTVKNSAGVFALAILLCGLLLAAVWAVFPQDDPMEPLEFTPDRWRRASGEQRGCMVDSLMLQYDRLNGMTQEDVASLLGGNGAYYSLGVGRDYMEGIVLNISFDPEGKCQGFFLDERHQCFYDWPAIPFSKEYLLEEYHPVFDAIQAHRKGLNKQNGSG